MTDFKKISNIVKDIKNIYQNIADNAFTPEFDNALTRLDKKYKVKIIPYDLLDEDDLSFILERHKGLMNITSYLTDLEGFYNCFNWNLFINEYLDGKAYLQDDCYTLFKIHD